MKDETEKPSDQQQPGNHPEGGDSGKGHLVTVSFDGEPKQIRQGRYSVSELKKVLGVQAGYELDEIVSGLPRTLSDGDHINVKEGDVFVSHVPAGSSS